MEKKQPLFLVNTAQHPKGQVGVATFEIRDGGVYPTAQHADGADANPWYEVKGDRLFPASGHPQRAPGHRAWYAIRGGQVYPAEGHPHGGTPDPFFDLKDSAPPRSA